LSASARFGAKKSIAGAARRQLSILFLIAYAETVEEQDKKDQ
jgi:hypothetical protein